ncbi:hypothetical protein AB0M68_32535 [Streptomyces sp. NPDC051453]|uniref:hypothetical protein n=1 Tax=Streptomyces sp. NPDC051453 TaxID=3154941 RepID=UPI003425973C
MGDRTLHAARHGIATGDWLPCADDAWRILRSVSGPWIVILPLPGPVGHLPQALWTSPWQTGEQALHDAHQRRTAMTWSLFGYRIPAAPPLMRARTVHHGPSVLAAADDLGRLPVCSPKLAPSRPTWALLNSVEGRVLPDPPPDVAGHQLLAWAAAASVLAMEGPLHARRLPVRQAPPGARARAAALIGLCGGWLFLHRSDPSFRIGPHELPEPPLPNSESDSHRRAVRDVLRVWRRADSARTTASAVDTVLGLLGGALPLLMSSSPAGFHAFDHWFQEHLSIAPAP